MTESGIMIVVKPVKANVAFSIIEIDDVPLNVTLLRLEQL